MNKVRVLVGFLLLCGVSLVGIFCVLELDITSTLIHPILKREETFTKRAQGSNELIYAIPLRSIEAIELQPAHKIQRTGPFNEDPQMYTEHNEHNRTTHQQHAVEKSSFNNDTAAVYDHESPLTTADSLQQGHAMEASNAEIVALSQNPDIDARGQWQKQQIDRYCHKYREDGLLYQLPNKTEYMVRKRLLRHMIFDDERQLIFCFIPKVGCTNMRRFLFVLQGIIPEETIHLESVSEEEYLGPGVQRASFLNVSLTDEERVRRIKNYYKFIIIRNPLERLLSAFLNKISRPLNFLQLDTFEMHRRTILEHARPQDLDKWLELNGSYPLHVTFSDFITWITDSNNALLDEHFASITNNAHPCRIRYDFYGNFKLYSLDMAQIIRKLKAKPEYFRDQSTHVAGHETKDLLELYYSQLGKDLKRCLFEYFYQELDFYYHLYPEERTVHVKLLEVDELVE